MKYDIITNGEQMTNAQYRRFHALYLLSNMHTVFHCYKTPSQEKQIIFDYFKHIDGTRGHKILSYNGYVFTIGFYAEVQGLQIFCVATKNHLYYFTEFTED